MCREIQLPNIIGVAKDIRVKIGSQLQNNGTGAFSSEAGNNSLDSNQGSQLVQNYTFNASNANAKYTGSDLQPKAGLALLCIKT